MKCFDNKGKINAQTRGYGLPVVTTPAAAQIVNTVQTHIGWLDGFLYNTRGNL